MIPDFDPNGNLPPGVHKATWSQLCKHFGHSEHRKKGVLGTREFWGRSLFCHFVFAERRERLDRLKETVAMVQIVRIIERVKAEDLGSHLKY